MTYLVLAYPKISKEDYQFIQDYRKLNDPKYFSLVNPHFTLVFASSNISEQDFINEVDHQSKNISKFDFEIKCATINQDDSGDFYHEFLVPDLGYSNIVKLHDKLYCDKFSDNLRFDIDFIPHIGIGNSEDVKICKKRVDKLNARNITIKGSIEVIDIIKYEGNKVTTIKTLELL